MNMLVQPSPLPEELDRGYLGRIMRINGYRRLKEMTEAMAAHFGREGTSRRELTVHALLSRMAAMSEVQFAQRCRRQFKIDHLCQLNFDQGSKAGCLAPGCG